MESIYKHLSDDTLKELYVVVMRVKCELISNAPVIGLFKWYMSHVYGKEQMDVETGVWAEMYDRGLLDDDNNVVS